MSFSRNITSGLRSLFRKEQVDRELDEELRAYQEMATEEKMRQGMSPKDALREVRLERGGLELAKEVVRSGGWEFFVETCWHDVRFGLRMLRKSTGFMAAVVLTLALGIGATTAIFSVVYGIIIQPLPFPQSNQLVMIWEVPPDRKKPNVVLLDNFIAWKQRSRSFQSMAAFYGAPMNLIGTNESEQVPGLKVTSEFFSTLGTAPLLGRTFRPGEYDRDEPREVVLSYSAWQQRFNGSPDVLGKRISIDATHHEIIGVMPAGFAFPGEKAELYVPLGITLDSGRNSSVVGRLRPDAGLGAAKAEIAMIAAHTASENVASNAGWSATVVPLLDQTVATVRPILLLLSAAVAFVLLLVCANIANLLMMRSTSRLHEISLRFAFGASQFRIMRQLLVENLILACFGGVLGLVLAAIAISFIKTSVPESLQVPRLYEIHLNVPVLLFAGAISIVSALMFGLGPAVQCLKRDLTHDLHAATRSITSGRKVRNVFVVSEVALALVLVTSAGLMVRSFVRLSRVDAGFHAEHVLTMRMLLLPVRNEQFHAEVVNDILERIRSVPGVVAAGSIGILPMQGTNSGSWYYRADTPEPPPERRPAGDISIITPGYFRALRIPILRGRDFDPHDRTGSLGVAILNHTAAHLLFPGEDPVGKRVRVWWNGSPPVEIVGVAADIRHSELNSPPDPCLFMPNDQQPFPFSSLVIRTMGDPVALEGAIRQQIRDVDLDQGIAKIEELQQLVADSIARPRLETLVLSAFGFVALGLSCMGVYGLLAFSVAERSREIGIRVALGASRASVLRMILGDGIRVTFFGLILGMLGAVGFTRLLRTVLFEVQPQDPITLIVVTGILVTISMLACYFPARRATRVDPLVALRYE